MDIRAYHTPTKQWRFAVAADNNTAVRLDPHAGETLDEFDVYEVTITVKVGRTESFIVGRRLNHLPRRLS